MLLCLRAKAPTAYHAEKSIDAKDHAHQPCVRPLQQPLAQSGVALKVTGPRVSDSGCGQQFHVPGYDLVKCRRLVLGHVH
eukprot:5603532-Amphidinium_carterae.1